MGREPDGSWGFWYGSQDFDYRAKSLPVDMIVCADGDGLNVRAKADPNSAVVKLVPDGSQVRAEQFVLTKEAAKDFSGSDGWYRISGPVEGWVNVSYVSIRLPGQKDCAIRDLRVRGIQR